MGNPVGFARTVLFTQATTGTSQPIPLRGAECVAVYVTGYGTISAGTLVIEEASYDPNDSPYVGVWSTTNTIDLTTLTGASTTGDMLKAIVPASAPGSYVFDRVRARFSVDVSGSGGSASVALVWR